MSGALPLRHVPLRMQTSNHPVGSAPSLDSSLTAELKSLGSLEAASPGSESATCIHPRHTCASNISREDPSLCSIKDSSGVISSERAVVRDAAVLGRRGVPLAR